MISISQFQMALLLTDWHETGIPYTISFAYDIIYNLHI